MADNRPPKSCTDGKRQVNSFTDAEIAELSRDPAKIFLLIEDTLIEDPEYPANFFCRLFNITRNGWDQLCHAGHITRTSPGKSRLMQGIKEYRDYLGKAGKRGNATTDSKNREEARLVRARRLKAEISIQKEASELIDKSQFYGKLADVFKILVQNISSMQDVLERDCDLDPISVKRVETICNASRQNMYDQIQECYLEAPEIKEAKEKEDFLGDLLS